MTELLGARRLRELLDAYGIRPRKSLGQNFVVDPNTIRKVMSAAEVDSEDHVLEIGAGAGSLTLGLAAAAERVIALEVDPVLNRLLAEVLAGVDNVEVIEADALTYDLASIEASKVVANLPYNVATPVVLRVLEEAPQIEQLMVMTQKEVGERLAAVPGSKVYGAPTVAAAYFATVRLAGVVSRKAFYPVPNVDSVLVRVQRRATVPDVEYEMFSKVVRAAFGQRRKTLRNSLAALSGSTDQASAALAQAGIDESTRPEDTPPEAFADLARFIVQG